ncbi:MAG: hypothetical protein ACRDHG_10295 [Anaerolineales bacterium]
MKPPTSIAGRDRFVWVPVGLLLLASAFGIIAGAAISMYYDVVPAMGSYADTLSSIQAALYFLAVVPSLSYLPMTLMAATSRQWRQAYLLAIAGLAPLIIFLASAGLLSHYLWWGPISDTGRFHMLHHTLVAAIPLSLLYWLFLRSSWRPHLLATVPSPSRTALVATAAILLVLVIGAGTLMFGLASATLLAIAAVIGVVVFMFSRRMAG